MASIRHSSRRGSSLSIHQQRVGTLEFPEQPRRGGVFTKSLAAETFMDKKTDDKLDPKAKGRKTAQSDFDRNRDGLYGGLPKARDDKAPGPEAKKPHPGR
jgi:hypothetical protein